MSAGLFEYRGTAAGLNEPLIWKVILSFYEKVRRDPLLGPIFEEAIGDDWDPHIERIMLFWLTATGLKRGYDGRNFMPAQSHGTGRSTQTSYPAGSNCSVRPHRSTASSGARRL